MDPPCPSPERCLIDDGHNLCNINTVFPISCDFVSLEKRLLFPATVLLRSVDSDIAGRRKGPVSLSVDRPSGWGIR